MGKRRNKDWWLGKTPEQLEKKAEAKLELKRSWAELRNVPFDEDDAQRTASMTPEEKREAFLQERADEAAQVGADLDTYGAQCGGDIFGGRQVTFYANGYVKVFRLRPSKASYEKLVAVEATSDTQKKSGFGRAVGAVASAGVSLGASNIRGDAYLTITTDRQVHVLHEEAPSANVLAVGKRLEAEGRALIARTASAGPPQPVAEPVGETTDSSVPEKLRQLKSMLDEGLLTQDEFDKHKSRLLDSM